MTLHDGVLFFPVTPFGADGELDLTAFAAHLETGLVHRPGGVFVACGTGEFHALAPDEHRRLVARAAEVIAGRVPLYAGAGGALPLARAFADGAATAGADGLLLLPPYLVSGPPRGLVDYVTAVAASSRLPLILYNRDPVRFTPETAAELAPLPGVVGFKDGRGDIAEVREIVQAIAAGLAGDPKADAFGFFNGTPTAEFTQRAYRAVGVPAYSSAVFCFLPELATAFYAALRDGHDELVDRLLAEFFDPLVALRDTTPGYAVSLVKAGVRLTGLDVGSVRPPLADPTPEHLAALAELIETGRAIAGADPVPTPAGG